MIEKFSDFRRILNESIEETSKEFIQYEKFSPAIKINRDLKLEIEDKYPSEIIRCFYPFEIPNVKWVLLLSFPSYDAFVIDFHNSMSIHWKKKEAYKILTKWSRMKFTLESMSNSSDLSSDIENFAKVYKGELQ